MLCKLLAITVSTVLLIGCEIPQSDWNVKDAVDDVVSEHQGECYFDGFDVICLVPGPKGEPGKDGKDGKDGRNGRDGKTIITRHYLFSHPDTEESFTVAVTVELPPATQETGEPDPGGAAPDPEKEALAPGSVDEIDIIKVIPPPPTQPSQPTKVRCGGNTCHVEIRSGTPWYIIEPDDPKELREEKPISDEAYENWIKFLKELQEVGLETLMIRQFGFAEFP